MVFWRKKKKIKEQEGLERADSVTQLQEEPAVVEPPIADPPAEPVIEPPTTEPEPVIDPASIAETEPETLDEQEYMPEEASEVPETTESKAPSTKEAESSHDSTPSAPEKTGGWLSRLTSGLSKSTNKLSQGLTDLVTKKKLDEETLEQLEDVLIEADLGPKTAARLIEEFSKDRFGKDISEDEIKTVLASSMEAILADVAQPLEIKKPKNGPFVVVMCGVNGVGKTTTIGKYAHHLIHVEKKSVMIAAGDTFRAAAVEQLQEWANRSGAKFLSKDLGADAAAVAYEAYEQAKAEGVDVLFIDTAGRLHNKSNLMAELEKIIRVLKKQDESLPHATLLVLDATTGQNAFAQLETFKDMVGITGLIVTKLDGSAKGGVLVGLADQFGVPVHAIGVGESIEDMQPFCAREYARTLVGLES